MFIYVRPVAPRGFADDLLDGFFDELELRVASAFRFGFVRDGLAVRERFLVEINQGEMRAVGQMTLAQKLLHLMRRTAADIQNFCFTSEAGGTRRRVLKLAHQPRDAVAMRLGGRLFDEPEIDDFGVK